MVFLESPANFGFSVPYPDFFNMSLGFRHDTIASSPYGYTVKLAPTSKMKGQIKQEIYIRCTQIFNLSKIEGKSKGAAWFVSHCGTNSHREKLVAQLQFKYYNYANASKFFYTTISMIIS
uniref:DNA-directed RNA polymerase n=1 Tax=Heterorhabditis bacteriophora TaxID=37862 RepID=A0A1I7WFF2_HETBA